MGCTVFIDRRAFKFGAQGEFIGFALECVSMCGVYKWLNNQVVICK